MTLIECVIAVIAVVDKIIWFAFPFYVISLLEKIYENVKKR